MIATDEDVKNTRKLIAAGYLTDNMAQALPPYLSRIEADRATIRAKDALIAELVEALGLAERTFRGYAVKHFEKGTPAGDAKADANLKLSDEMFSVLAKAKEAGQ